MAKKKSKKKKASSSYLSPGVYVEEISSGAKPIEGVGTAVAAFVGFARRNPVGTLVTALAAFAAIAAAVRAIRS
jgi:phage tail sheath protein FI